VHSKKAIGHYGGDKGFRSFLMMIPEQDIGIVLLANCDYNEDFRQEIVYEIASLMHH
ncbi:MAG: CubicO group peptidase (beta-lactamase class C family), partial [Dokdonia sp.]